MAALTSAGMRTPESKVSVILALSPSSPMDVTVPTGTSAIWIWAPLARSPMSLNTAVAVRWLDGPLEHEVKRRGQGHGADRGQHEAAGPAHSALQAARARWPSTPPVRG